MATRAILVKNELRALAITLHTPLRENMKKSRSPETVKALNNPGRLIETVIGQLVEQFNIEKSKPEISGI